MLSSRCIYSASLSNTSSFLIPYRFKTKMALFNGVETRPSVGELLIRTLNCRLMPDRRPEKMAQGQKKKKGISAKRSGSKKPLGPKKGGA